MRSEKIEMAGAAEFMLTIAEAQDPNCMMIPFPPFDPDVTDRMIHAALEELRRWTGHPLLILPRLLNGNDEWDRHVMQLVLEAAFAARRGQRR